MLSCLALVFISFTSSLEITVCFKRIPSCICKYDHCLWNWKRRVKSTRELRCSFPLGEVNSYIWEIFLWKKITPQEMIYLTLNQIKSKYAIMKRKMWKDIRMRKSKFLFNPSGLGNFLNHLGSSYKQCSLSYNMCFMS